MAEVKERNWREERGTELERAKKLFKVRPIRLIDVSKRTGIPYQTIRKYSRGFSNLDNSDWSHVSKLAHMWDVVQIDKDLPRKEVPKFQGKLHSFFNDSRAAHPDMKPMLNRMEQIVTTDPLAAAELYKADQEGKK